MPLEGVDYAWSRPDIGQLAAAGKRFACRYGGPGSIEKQLDPAEARSLSAAGVAIVANAEGSATGLLGGWSAGVDWAVKAQVHFASCDMPPGRPIYLSVDFDVTAAQWPAVAQALRGAASILGADRVGVYGGRRAIEWARRDNVAQWFWQTYAWSAGYWVPGNHIEQYRNGVELAGANLDLDRAMQPDFGQWPIGVEDMTPEQDRLLRNAETYAWKGSAGEDPIKGILDPAGKPIEPGMPNMPMQTARQALQVAEQALAVARETAARPQVQPAPVDPAALEAVFEPMLAAMETRLNAKIRDAVAVFGERGAAGVRAEG